MKSKGDKKYTEKMNKTIKPICNNSNNKTNINSKEINNTYPNNIQVLFKRLGIE